VFGNSGGTWTQKAELAASDAAANDEFGWSVAVDGTTLVFGGPAPRIPRREWRTRLVVGAADERRG